MIRTHVTFRHNRVQSCIKCALVDRLDDAHDLDLYPCTCCITVILCAVTQCDASMAALITMMPIMLPDISMSCLWSILASHYEENKQAHIFRKRYIYSYKNMFAPD